MSDVTQISGNQIKDGAIVNAKVSPSAAIDYTKINFSSATPSIIGAESVLTFSAPLSRSVNTISLNVVPVNKGGTGLASAVEKQIYFANNSGTFAQSQHLVWDYTNFRLGIKTPTPSYEIDVAGSIRCDGQFIGVLNGTSYFTQGLKNTNGDEVSVASFTVPTAGQALVATSATTADWASITADGILPDQSGNGSKFLTTNGSAASWADIPTDIPDQATHSGEFLTTNGSNVSWAAIPVELPAMSVGTKGQYLSNNGSAAQWNTIGIVAIIDNYTTLALTPEDSGAVFTNLGDADGSVLELPTAASGITYTVYVQTAQTITITANTGDTIRIDTSVTAVAGSITSATVGSAITLVAINDTEWVATSVVGTWTI